MINLIFLILLIIISGCSSKPSSESLTEESNLQKLMSQGEVRIKEIPVLDKVQAKKVIQNQLNFIKLIYVQSVDPYFGQPKWSKKCLESNVLGNISETPSTIQSVSSLYLDQNWDTGHCPEGQLSFPAYVIYLYCEADTKVREIKVFKKPLLNIQVEDLCL